MRYTINIDKKNLQKNAELKEGGEYMTLLGLVVKMLTGIEKNEIKVPENYDNYKAFKFSEV